MSARRQPRGPSTATGRRHGLATRPRRRELRRTRNRLPADRPEAIITCMRAEPDGREARTPAATETHLQRQVAESFGADADRYDRSRPSYPGALVERILAAS